MDDETPKFKTLIRKINENSETEAWYDIIMKFIIERKFTAKIFLKYFFDVLGQTINNSNDLDKNNAIKLAQNVSKLFKRPIPDWIIITE